MSHEGRYAEIAARDAHKTDNDYISCKNNGKHFRVALTHASLDKKPTHETHGGATPEEVLVPFVVITNKIVETTLGLALTELQRTTPTPLSAPLPAAPETTGKAGFVENDLF
jgi:hypothetical protein